MPLAVVANSLHGMTLFDDEQRCVEANLAACVLMQRPMGRVVGHTIRDFSAAEAVVALDQRWTTLLRDGTESGQWPLQWPQGQVLHIDYFSTAHVRPGQHLIVFSARTLENPAPVGGTGSVTARERDVLRLLALGYTGPEIAERLVISVDTVRSHLRRLKAKLGARTLPHLIALSLREGLLGDTAHTQY